MPGRAFAVTDVLTSDEIKDLCRLTSWRATFAIGLAWAMIIALFAAAALWPHPLVLTLAILLIAGRMVALGVLGHDAAHRTLYKSRVVNDAVGVWLLDAWIWSDLARYRANHLKHHVVSGTLDDPDLGTVTPFPMSRGRLALAFARDLLGVTALLRVANNVLVDLEFVRYSAVGDIVPLTQAGRTNRAVLMLVAQRMGPTALTWSALFAVLGALGVAWLAWLWIAAWASPLQAFLRCRATQEHACVPDPAHPVNGSRTVGRPVWDRLTVGPCGINFHIEHHLIMTVPFYNLPRMHRMLRERGALDGAPIERDMLATLRHVTSPGAPNAHADPPLGPSGVRPAPEPLPPLDGPLTASALLPKAGEALARLARQLRGAPPAARA